VPDSSALAAALARARADDHGWVRGVGYAESVAGPLDATALDRLHHTRPVRLQHRSGALWMLNTAAITALDAATADHPGIERDHHGAPTGRLWRADGWLRTRLPRPRPPGLREVGAQLARLGITSVTDATPDLDAAAIAAIVEDMRTGDLPQRVHLLGAPVNHPPASPPSIGPYKITLADSALPDLDSLVEVIRTVHATGRAVAVHCVTRESLVLLLTALNDAGTISGDRIEHAALVPHDLIGELARLGLRVVTQPGFLADRGDDFLRDLPAHDHPDLYRVSSLKAAGVPVGLSSDAPYGPLDPWAVIKASVDRRTRSGRVASPAERITSADAVAGYLSPPTDPGGPSRTVRLGMAADLLLLHGRRADMLADPVSALVRMTFIGGTLVHDQWLGST
jgi:predicted amidohydrolase YtcJ